MLGRDILKDQPGLTLVIIPSPKVPPPGIGLSAYSSNLVYRQLHSQASTQILSYIQCHQRLIGHIVMKIFVPKVYEYNILITGWGQYGCLFLGN